MDGDKEEDGPSMGGKPNRPKGPNLLNQPKRDRALIQRQAHHAEGERQPQPVQPQSKIPPFGDGSTISKDWTLNGLFDDIVNQKGDTCGSVVFTRLLQASYNEGKPIAQHRTLSYQDLANHIRETTGKKKFSFRNMNIPIKYIRDVGLHRDKKISGAGVKTQGDFDSQRDATKQDIYAKLETTPFGIVVQDLLDLHTVGMGIHHVPTDRDEHCDEHAMLVVAKGETKDGVQFLVAQNS